MLNYDATIAAENAQAASDRLPFVSPIASNHMSDKSKRSQKVHGDRQRRDDGDHYSGVK